MALTANEIDSLKNEIFKNSSALYNFFEKNNYDLEKITALNKIMKDSLPILFDNRILVQHRLQHADLINTATENLVKQVKQLLPKAADLWNKLLFGKIKALVNDQCLIMKPVLNGLVKQHQLHSSLQVDFASSTPNANKVPIRASIIEQPTTYSPKIKPMATIYCKQ